MTCLKSQLVMADVQTAPRQFRGLLAGLEAGPVVSWGLLEAVCLRLAAGTDAGARERFASPEQHLELVEVPTYGTVVFRNTSQVSPLIAPMHVGFFQPGAQNHATSRALVLGAGETLQTTDCFCVQAAQGGLLQESQQRFLMLPLGLRHQALSRRHNEGYSRLWNEIDSYTRHHGVATGGHLERFLRPNFGRLLPLRHALESVPGQIGAAWFIAGRLAGIEVAPNEPYWQGVAPVLAMYCYGPAALLAEQRGQQRVSEPLDLEDLRDLEDLADRLRDVRDREAASRADIVDELATLFFDQQVEENRHGLRVTTLGYGPWSGQVVRENHQVVYASVFRDVAAESGRDKMDVARG